MDRSAGGDARVFIPRTNNTPEWTPEQCVICVRKRDGKMLESGKLGFDTFIRTVKQRKDEVLKKLIEKFSTIDDVPSTIRYHINCYKTYTSKRNQQFSATGKENQTSSAKSANTRASIIWSSCLVCHKDRKRSKGKEVKTYRIMKNERLENMKRAAIKRGRDDVYAKLCHPDAVKRGRYHINCMSRFNDEKITSDTVTENPDKPTEYQQFPDLIEEIRRRVIDEGEIMTLNEITKMYNAVMREEDDHITRFSLQRIIQLFRYRNFDNSSTGPGKILTGGVERIFCARSHSNRDSTTTVREAGDPDLRKGSYKTYGRCNAKISTANPKVQEMQQCQI